MAGILPKIDEDEDYSDEDGEARVNRNSQNSDNFNGDKSDWYDLNLHENWVNK